MSPANTPKGYPYPVGTDPMSQGDDVLAALAGAIDTKLGASAAGSVLFTGFATTNPQSKAVTFPAGRFTTGPSVFVQLTADTTNMQSARLMAGGPTATSVTVHAWRETGTNDLTVYWRADQQA